MTFETMVNKILNKVLQYHKEHDLPMRDFQIISLVHSIGCEQSTEYLENYGILLYNKIIPSKR